MKKCTITLVVLAVAWATSVVADITNTTPPVNPGSNPLSWSGDITLGEEQKLAATFNPNASNNLEFVENSARAAALDDKNWNNPTNSTGEAKFDVTVNLSVSKPYPTFFSGGMKSTQPGQGGGGGDGLYWNVSGLALTEGFSSDHEPFYLPQTLPMGQSLIDLYYKVKMKYNPATEVAIDKPASKNYTHGDLISDIKTAIVAAGQADGVTVPAAALGHFHSDQSNDTGKISIKGQPTAPALVQEKVCDKCEENERHAYSGMVWANMDVDIETFTYLPTWNMQGANETTTTWWPPFEKRIKDHEMQHESDHNRIYGGFVEKYGKKVWRVTVCFGSNGHADATKAVKDFQNTFMQLVETESKNLRQEYEAAEQNVETTYPRLPYTSANLTGDN